MVWACQGWLLTEIPGSPGQYVAPFPLRAQDSEQGRFQCRGLVPQLKTWLACLLPPSFPAWAEASCRQEARSSPAPGHGKLGVSS